jgi:hypothetical protein
MLRPIQIDRNPIDPRLRGRRARPPFGSERFACQVLDCRPLNPNRSASYLQPLAIRCAFEPPATACEISR